MSGQEQDTAVHLIRLLMSHRATGKIVGWALTLIVTVTACVTLITWNLIVVEYISGVNFAKKATPIILSALIEMRDSLDAKEGYHFHPIEVK